MKVAFGAVAVLFPLLCQNARADTHCYTFRNDSAMVVTLNFSYQPATGSVITGAALEPGKTTKGWQRSCCGTRCCRRGCSTCRERRG